MAIDLVDIVKLDAGHLIVGADGLARLGDILTQLRVEDEIDLHIGVTVLHMLEHIGHGRAERVEVGLRPSRVFILTHGLTGPTVVGGAENEDDIRIPR